MQLVDGGVRMRGQLQNMGFRLQDPSNGHGVYPVCQSALALGYFIALTVALMHSPFSDTSESIKKKKKSVSATTKEKVASDAKAVPCWVSSLKCYAVLAH